MAFGATGSPVAAFILSPPPYDSQTITIARINLAGEWGALESISPTVASALGGLALGFSNLNVGTSDSGAVMAAWDYVDTQTGPTERDYVRQVQVNYSVTGTVWSTGSTQILNANPGEIAQKISLHMRRDGAAWAVWSERTFKGTHSFFDMWAVFAARFVPGVGWLAAEKVSPDHPNGTMVPRISTGDSGDPTVVYEHEGFGGTRILYSSVRAPNGVWGPEVTLANLGNNNGFGPEPAFAVDASGNAIAVWRQFDGVRQAIVSRRYTPITGWEPAIELTVPSNDNGHAPQIAMDPQGNAFAVWHEFDGISFAIWAARFDAAVGWTTLSIISGAAANFADNSTLPRIGFDASGNAVAIWHKSFQFGLSTTVLRANAFRVGTGWTGEETISASPEVGPISDARLAVSPSGKAIATWIQQEVTGVLRYRSSMYSP